MAPVALSRWKKNYELKPGQLGYACELTLRSPARLLCVCRYEVCMKVKLNKEIMSLREYVYELKMMEENKHKTFIIK